MDMTTRTRTPLRQRMMEDMRMRKLEPRTQEGYIRAVRELTVYLKRSPDTATVEDLRNFQLHLVDAGTSPITLSCNSCAQTRGRWREMLCRPSTNSPVTSTPENPPPMPTK